MAKKQTLPVRVTNAKLVAWERFARKVVFPIEKGSRAGVVVDREGKPTLFIFDTFALLDVLSAIDEKLVDRLSDNDYHSRKVNPAGWLINEIEARLPLSDEYLRSLKAAIKEAKREGWIPLEKLEGELGLA